MESACPSSTLHEAGQEIQLPPEPLVCRAPGGAVESAMAAVVRAATQTASHTGCPAYHHMTHYAKSVFPPRNCRHPVLQIAPVHPSGERRRPLASPNRAATSSTRRTIESGPSLSPFPTRRKYDGSCAFQWPAMSFGGHFSFALSPARHPPRLKLTWQSSETYLVSPAGSTWHALVRNRGPRRAKIDTSWLRSRHPPDTSRGHDSRWSSPSCSRAREANLFCTRNWQSRRPRKRDQACISLAGPGWWLQVAAAGEDSPARALRCSTRQNT